MQIQESTILENRGGKMKFSTQLNELFNAQVLHEMKNMMIYHQIQSYFEDLQLKNLASYFSKQAEDEHGHAKLFMQHINDRTGGKVELREIPFDGVQINSIDDIAKLFVETEEITTDLIENLYSVAHESKSFIDLSFIEKMLQEQVEEEDSANEFAIKIKMVKDLVLFDSTFGE